MTIAAVPNLAHNPPHRAFSSTSFSTVVANAAVELTQPGSADRTLSRRDGKHRREFALPR